MGSKLRSYFYCTFITIACGIKRKCPLVFRNLFFYKEKFTNSERFITISTQYLGLHFSSVVCTLLYIALGTRSDITYIVEKLSKTCREPGIEDYQALFLLLGYLHLHVNKTIKYYSNVKESPIHNICVDNNVSLTRIMMFSDAS